MDKQKDIYCDLGFWKNLSGSFSTIKMTTDLDELKRNQDLMDWYGLLCRSHLFFDCSVNDFEDVAMKDFYLKAVWKKSTDGRCKLDFSPGAVAAMCAGPSQMESKMYNSLFLTGENHSRQAYSVGVVTFSGDDIHNHSEVFCDNGPSIKRDSKNNWLQILKAAKAQHNCNSMVIADNYVFQDINANLFRILDALLPKKLDTAFYLTVFSLNNSADSKLDKKRKETIEKELKVMRPDLTIVIEVLSCTTDDFHDRGIITNYLWIEIGAGFNLFKGDGTAKKTTNIHVSFPMIIPEDRMKCSRDGYWNIIEDAKKCLKKRNERSNNRLLR